MGIRNGPIPAHNWAAVLSYEWRLPAYVQRRDGQRAAVNRLGRLYRRRQPGDAAIHQGHHISRSRSVLYDAWAAAVRQGMQAERLRPRLAPSVVAFAVQQARPRSTTFSSLTVSANSIATDTTASSAA